MKRFENIAFFLLLLKTRGSRCYCAILIASQQKSNSSCKQWTVNKFRYFVGPVGYGSRIHRLHLCRGVRPHPTNECPRYETKQSDNETPVVMELYRIAITPKPTLARVVASDRILSMGQIELNFVITLNWIVWN